MQCYYDLFTEERQTGVSLGFFDGVHKGHRSVIELAVDQKHNGLLPVCLTFSESPKSVISGVKAPYLMTLEDKVKALESEKASAVNEQDFERAAKIRDEQKAVQEKLDSAKKSWQEKRSENCGEVDAQVIAKIVSDWTGIPVVQLTK